MKLSLLLSLSLLLQGCAGMQAWAEPSGAPGPAAQEGPSQNLAAMRRHQDPGESAAQRVSRLSCAELPEAAYGFQGSPAQGGGPESHEVGEAVQKKLVQCGKYTELFTGKPWAFDPKVCVDGARTPEGEKALRALLVRKNRDELAAVSKCISRLVNAPKDGDADYAEELASAYDVFPSNDVFLYLSKKQHPKAPGIALLLLSSPDWKTRMLGCRSVVDLKSPSLKRQAESLASNDSYREWSESSSGGRIVRSYPVREMCKLSLDVASKKKP